MPLLATQLQTINLFAVNKENVKVLALPALFSNLEIANQSSFYFNLHLLNLTLIGFKLKKLLF
jgi:hypothetical protein